MRYSRCACRSEKPCSCPVTGPAFRPVRLHPRLRRAHSVDGGASWAASWALPASRDLYPADFVNSSCDAAFRVLDHSCHPACCARRAVIAQRKTNIVAWLCKHAPRLWVVVHVCALLMRKWQGTYCLGFTPSDMFLFFMITGNTNTNPGYIGMCKRNTIAVHCLLQGARALAVIATVRSSRESKACELDAVYRSRRTVTRRYRFAINEV